jgi:hypothetical protein
MTADAITSSASEDRVLDRTHIDWLTVTHADVEAPGVVPARSDPEASQRDDGLPRVRERRVRAILAWHGREPRPAMLVLPGSALSAWRVDFSDLDLVQELSRISRSRSGDSPGSTADRRSRSSRASVAGRRCGNSSTRAERG